MKFKKNLLSLLMSGLCLISLVSCGGKDSESKNIPAMDDNVKIVFSDKSYNNVSLSELSSSTGKTFEKGDDFKLYFTINKDMKITSISYKIQYDGLDYNEKNIKIIGDHNIEDWNETYKYRNTNRGNGEYCYDLTGEYEFSLWSFVYLLPAPETDPINLKDNDYINTRKDNTYKENFIDYSLAKNNAIFLLDIDAKAGNGFYINITTSSTASISYKYKWYEDLFTGNKLENTGYANDDKYHSFTCNKVTISDLEVCYMVY